MSKGLSTLTALMNSTPQGAAAGLLTSAASTPASSQSGDITTGAKTFGGITKGTQIPSWVWAGALAFGAIVVLTKMRRN